MCQSVKESSHSPEQTHTYNHTRPVISQITVRMENDRLLALYVSPTGGGQPKEDKEGPQATMSINL